MLQSSSLVVSGLNGETTVDLGTITTSCHRLIPLAFTAENLSHQFITIRLQMSKPLDDTFTISAVRELVDDRGRSPQSVLPDPSAALNRSHVLDYPKDDTTLTLPPESKNTYQVALLDVSVQRAVSSSSQTNQKILRHRQFRAAIVFQDDQSSVELATLCFYGSFCESWIRPDLTLLDFGHCTVSAWVYRDITIRNLSALPARCCISHSIRPTLEAGNVTELRFSDPVSSYETDPRLICVQPLGERSVRIAFRATAPVDRDTWLCLQNLDNAEDFWHIHVVAKVGTARVAQKVFVSCGSELSFGDCYANFQTFRDIVVLSNYKEDVTLALKTDRPRQVSFEVLSDWSLEDGSGADAKRTRSRICIEQDMFDVASNQSYEGESDKRKTLGQSDTSSPEPEFVSSGSKSLDKQKLGKKPSKFPESVILRSGQKKRVRVWYLPVTMHKDHRPNSRNSPHPDPGKLCDDSFQLSFELSSGETRRVVAHSRVCESILRLERSELHLGNCNVMTKYRTMLSLINCSDLPAFVGINYVSQCVSTDAHEFQILPRQGYDLGLEFVPRQVNPGYHKEITISNLRNSNASNTVFTLKADCVDDQGISMHALFYKLLAPNATNEIDFGVTVANHPAIRAVKIRNITEKRLILKFGECVGVTTYLPSVTALRSGTSASKSDRYQHDNMKKCLCQRKLRSTFLGTKSSMCEATLSATGRALIDVDITRTHQHSSSKDIESLRIWDFEASYSSLQRYRGADGANVTGSTEYDPLNVGDKSPQNGQSEKQGCWVDHFSSQSEGKASMLDSMPTFFSNHDSEMRYTEQQFRQEHNLQAAILAGCLSASETLVLEPKVESVIVLRFRPSDKDVKGKTKIRPIERYISVSMIDFDRSRLDDLPEATSKQMYHMAKLFGEGKASRPREVMLTVQACKSRMSIAPLRQLNFGSIAHGEQKDKAFTIVNLSEAPLLYEIRKTGSRIRDDIRFNLGKGTKGVVRPYFTRVVPFIFAPSNAGKFEEKIVIENRLDHTAGAILVVKAHIRPAECSESAALGH